MAPVVKMLAVLAPAVLAWAPVAPRASALTRRAALTPLVADGAEPCAAELTNENLVRIVREECEDGEVNALVWKCLGYRAASDGSYTADAVFPKWGAKYPTPPDLVGVTRVYSKDVDEPVLRANQALVATIPMAYKGGIKVHLAEVGWTGFKLEGLTPNKTRRAQCCNWLLFYREALFGRSLDELKAAKARDVEAENRKLRATGGSLAEARPPGRGPDAS